MNPGTPPFGRSTACVLFDLDGTFADTARDLHQALNRVLIRHGRPEMDFETLRPFVSHGSKAMLKASFEIEPEDPGFSALQKEFLDGYLERIALLTRPFDGIPELIDTLERQGVLWGIVTNKPARLTDPLMRELGLDQRACTIVSGDTTPYAKPHPEPILHACRVSGVDPGETLYVGDAVRDIEAGRRAGTRTLAARFGYLADDDRPEEWRADGLIDHPLDILAWL
jgi:N-acetyl-D-muramate 6-phosphate phosphatase